MAPRKKAAPPPPEPPEPRKDGLEEVKGRWADLGVGSVIEKDGRKWTVIETAIPSQFQYGFSHWIRFQAARGEVYACPPRALNSPVTMLRKPGEPLPAPARAANADEIDLLVRELGAVEIATQDTATGEWWCPNYSAGANHLPEIGNCALQRGEIEHLRVAHGMDVSALEALDPLDQIVALAKAHGPLHHKDAERRAIPGRGFPHRHVPEDLTLM